MVFFKDSEAGKAVWDDLTKKSNSHNPVSGNSGIDVMKGLKARTNLGAFISFGLCAETYQYFADAYSNLFNPREYYLLLFHICLNNNEASLKILKQLWFGMI